ncbi:MAG: peptidoglycan DD-metalloendopeptidase family protein [Gammaproteobacteria bacterium]
MRTTAFRSVPLIALLLFPFARAEDNQREKLDSLRSRIQEASSEKKQLITDYDLAQKDLQQQELELAEANKRLDEIRQTVQIANQQLKSLTERTEAEASTLTTQRQWLAQIIRAQYMTGHEDALRLVLNQDDPLRVQRLLVYHDVVMRARMQQVAAAGKSLADTRAIAESARLQSERLQSLQTQQLAINKEIAELRKARETTVHQLNNRIAATDKTLETLRESKHALEKLLFSLPTTPASTSASSSPDKATGNGLGRLKGKLPWPVNGHVNNPFVVAGTDQDRPHGVYIDAAAGTPVKVVADGVVRFADWFQGFGLLVIVDHGGGDISLYGYNQSLETKVGTTVTPGTIIAKVGDSGGQGKSALYFGIRHQGTPQNPAQWCH